MWLDMVKGKDLLANSNLMKFDEVFEILLNQSKSIFKKNPFFKGIISRIYFKKPKIFL